MALSKKQIMKMNDTWKNFRLQEYKLFKPGFQHGFDLSEFKPGGFKKVLKALGIPTIAKGSHTGGSDTSGGFYFRNKDIIIITGNNPITGKFRNKNREPDMSFMINTLENLFKYLSKDSSLYSTLLVDTQLASKPSILKSKTSFPESLGTHHFFH